MSAPAETSAAEQLQNRLNDPKIADGLNRLLDQVDSISFAVELIDGFVRRGDVITESIAETVGELKGIQNEKTEEFLAKAPHRIETGTKLADAADALDVDELAKSNVLERLTDPETLKSVNKLLDGLPLAAFMLESLEGLISRGDTVTENVSDLVKELHLEKILLGSSEFAALLDSLPKIKEAGEKLLDSTLMDEGLPKVIDAGVSMVESGMLDPQLVSTLGDLGKKSVETYLEVASKPVAPIGGLFATLKATKDPDVQKTVGFAFAFAKAFAKHLK